MSLDINATVIGSRDTPLPAQDAITDFAAAVQHNHGVVRSGGAPGADSACERGITDPHAKQIFLPYSNFNGVSAGVGVYVLDQLHSRHQRVAQEIASRFHPNWEAVLKKSTSVKMMTRNVFQILGPELKSPSDIVVMWAKGTRVSIAKKDHQNRIFEVPGGTGLAVRLAHHLEIPILHVDLPEHQTIIEAYRQGDETLFWDLLYKEGQWERQRTLNAVTQLRQSVGLDISAPPSGRWQRTPYRP